MHVGLFRRGTPKLSFMGTGLAFVTAPMMGVFYYPLGLKRIETEKNLMLCKRCNQEVPAERLEVMPETEICTKCSKAIGGEVQLYTSMDSTGKAGSMKKNYGGVSVTTVKKAILPLNSKTFGEME